MGKYNVLLVDDDPAVRRELQAALQELYEIAAVGSAEEAFAYLRSGRTDLILLDLEMPDMDGFEALTRFKSDAGTAQIPVVVLADDASDEREVHAFELGAADFLRKPVGAERLRKRLERRLRSDSARRRLSRNLEEEQRRAAKLRTIASTDYMTGLLNKYTFSARVSALLGQRVQGALLVMDLDGLKYVNDTFGHAAGDGMIVRFAGVLRRWAGEEMLCHLSGDEFAAFLPGVVEHDRLTERAEALLALTEQGMEVPDRSRVVSVSVGGAVCPEHGDSYAALFNCADSAMLGVKSRSPGRFSLAPRREQRHRDLPGRRDLTYAEQAALLAVRADEQRQSWVRFGEYRLIWNSSGSLLRSCGGRAVSVLFTFSPAGAPSEETAMEEATMEELGRCAAGCIAASGIRGVFSWYSVNQLLMLLQTPEWAEETAERLRREISDRMSGQLTAAYALLSSDAGAD